MSTCYIEQHGKILLKPVINAFYW